MLKYITEIDRIEDDENAICALALAYQDVIDTNDQVSKSLFVFCDRMTSALITAGYCTPRISE